MKAIRLHAYDKTPEFVEVPDPKVKGPFDIVVKIRTSATATCVAGPFPFPNPKPLKD